MADPHIYTPEEIRAAVNSKSPLEAFEMLLGMFQRMTLALEEINRVMQEEGPVVLFEPAVVDREATAADTPA